MGIANDQEHTELKSYATWTEVDTISRRRPKNWT